MKKSKLLFSVLASLLLSGCNSYTPETINLEFQENNSINTDMTKGALGDFSLLTPGNDQIIEDVPNFTWTACENAISYTLEVCSLETFDHGSNSVIYAKETNINGTSFKISSDLKTKNLTYYWRVTAVNQFNSKTVGKEKTSEVNSFYYKAKEAGEIGISMGEVSDWTLHKDGSKADIKIDHKDFFANGVDDSLVVSFEKENTNQGIPSSDGWIVVTKPLEQDLYGSDSLFLNFYYSGNDADVLIRMIDADGEYWYKNIQISQNAKQTILMKFSEFQLRTKDTTVQNSIFNYEHIQYFELVFEHAFGDGCCVIGNVKAVSFANYSNLFIEKLNFKNVPTSSWENESYNFMKTISEDGNELNLEYSTTAGFNGNEKGIGGYGYGFAKVPLNCYFASGNAIRVKIKYTGYSSNVKAVIRVYEEDKDRWSYEQPFSSLSSTEFTELTIPFSAFAKSEIRADGNRQFYYILQLQFGATGIYGSGSVTYKDVEIVTIPSVSSNPIQVGEDGLIESFESYNDRTQLYQHWETSVTNKDEGMFINTSDRFNDGVNTKAGQFNYKSDMGLASYDAYLNVTKQGAKAIKLWIKDQSSLKNEGVLSYLTEDDISPVIVIQLALEDGRWYRYTIDKAPRKWTEYVISFDDFILNSGVELETSDPFESQYVVNFAFGMQYFYYDQNGKAYPVYTESNKVLFDNISFVDATETKVSKLDVELEQDPETKLTLIDDFEYESEAKLKTRWFGLNGHEYEKNSLSNDVSSSGGNHSMKLDYKGSNSPSYATYPAFASNVQAKALQFDMKGDGAATLYINLYVKIGNSLVQYRCTKYSIANTWKRYVIGFDSTLFVPINNSNASALGIDSIRNVQRITFGIVGSNTEVSSIYIDNLMVNAAVKSFTTNTATAL